ncbi:MAG: carbohydrate-binding domain-containing protein [Gemmatimonas sp.]
MVDLTGFKLTFDDEFNSFTWSPDGSSGYKTTFYFGGRELWGNGDQQYYSDPSVGVNPFSLANGALHITAAPAAPGSNPDNQPYTSGMISTEGMFTQTYGYFEARIEVASGPGMWSSFWMLPGDKSWPPEIDALEAFGTTNPNGDGGGNLAYHGQISTNRNLDGGSWAAVNGDIHTEYHTYGVDWEPDVIRWYIDGQLLGENQKGTVATPATTDVPMYMLATLAVGGWAGPNAGETSVMGIDYIRAYSKDPNAHAVALQTISSPDGVDTTPIGATDANGVIGSGGGNPPPPPPNNPPPTGGTGVSVRVSEDAWTGDAQFVVKVDGVQVGGTQTATASHGAGQWQDIALAGTFPTGPHAIDITFLNDGWGGSAATDRNLYVQSVTINGDTLDWHTAQNGAANGMTAPDGAILAVNGTIHFSDPGSGGTTTPPPNNPPPNNPPPSGSGPLTVRVAEDAWNGDAQFTVTVDGAQFGGVQTATGSHAAGGWQDISIAGTLSTGPHTVAINFLNDGWGGTAATDRNLYVQTLTVNGEVLSYTTAQNDASNGMSAPDGAIMAINGAMTFHAAGTGGTPTPPPGGTVGPSTIVLHVAEDAWNGDAQFNVLVDGVQVGGTRTATASHAAHGVQDITLSGDFGAQGPGKVDVVFLNDAWGGTAATDRNLYVYSIDVNGHSFAGTSAANNAANGMSAPDAAIMAIDGTLDFNINHTAPPAIIG